MVDIFGCINSRSSLRAHGGQATFLPKEESWENVPLLVDHLLIVGRLSISGVHVHQCGLLSHTLTELSAHSAGMVDDESLCICDASSLVDGPPPC
jgi:hypothetical protein